MFTLFYCILLMFHPHPQQSRSEHKSHALGTSGRSHHAKCLQCNSEITNCRKDVTYFYGLARNVAHIATGLPGRG